jgi:Raf kinase inhibitor-like YbhB/YbcL family protein
MRLHIPSFADGAPIPAEFAFGTVDPVEHAALSLNRNPRVEWSDVPDGTRSLALVCHDSDVPSKSDDVNQEGKTVPLDLERVDFTHWVLVDIDPALGAIPAGGDSDAVTPQGKPGGVSSYGLRGRNDYTSWFAGDTVMGGVYHGYDGPCPPWNDTRLHHYVFTLYALDCETLPLGADFTRSDVLVAVEGHLLAQAAWTGTYSLNPALA